MFVGHIPPGVGILEASDAGPARDRALGRTADGLRGEPCRLAASGAQCRAPTESIQIDRAKCEDAVRHSARNGTYFSPSPLRGRGQGPKRICDFNLKIVYMVFKAGVPLLAGRIQMRDRTVTVGPGEMYVVPKGVALPTRRRSAPVADRAYRHTRHRR